MKVADEEDVKAQSEDEEARGTLIKNVRSWGDLNTDALLDTKCKFFSVPYIPGFIGYRVETKCAVVFGEPVCAPADQERLAEAFQKYCQSESLHIVYTMVSQNFTQTSLNQKHVAIQFGSKLVLDAKDNPIKRKGSKAVLVRKKVKHAVSDGVFIKEYVGNDPLIETAIEQVGRNWLHARHGAQIFIAHINFFQDRAGKRWFYAIHNEKIVGFLILNEIKEQGGWLLNNLMIETEAPVGTSELLITSTFQALETGTATRIVIGPVIEQNLQNVSGLSSLSTWMVRGLFRLSKRLFRLEGQTVFWEKFQPSKESSFLIFDKLNLRTLKGLMRALNVNYKKKEFMREL